MSPAVLWSIVGIGAAVVAVGGFFLFRALSRRGFDNKVRQLFETGQFELAVDKLAGVGRTREAADMLLRWGKVDRAAQIYIQLDEWRTAAELYERQRQFGTAAVYYLKADDLPQAARCYAKQGRADKAAELYRQAGQDDKAIQVFKDSGDFTAAAAIQLQAGGGEQAAVETLVQGGRAEEAAELLEKRGETEAAQTLLAEHFDRTNEPARAATAYEALGRLAEALERYRKAGDVAKTAELLERLERFDEAAPLFHRARQFERAASSYERSGNAREAARNYLLAGMTKQAVDNLLKENDVVSVGQIYHQYGYGPQALEVLNVAANHPQFKEAHVLRARMLERAGDLEGARNDLIALVTKLGLSERTIDVVFSIAEIYAQQGDPQNALRTLERTKQRGIQHHDLDRRIAQLAQVVEGLKAAAELTAAPEINVGAGLPESERYEFQKKLGQGGMGTVYKARDRKLGRIVAIKLLLDSDLPSDMAKKYFFREAQTVSGLSHPNIVGLYDFGEIDERPFIAMEYIEGRNLEQMLTKERPTLPVPQLIKICSQLATALDYAHQMKVIHRDVKLGNVMVTREEVVKLMDFGLAKAITENPDRSLLVIGTPYYMAPEQIAHDDIDHRVDIYALGILLFRVATGRLPFETGDVLRAQRFEAPPDPVSLKPDLPRKLAGIILHCLEKRPEDRPERASEVAEALLAISL